MPFKKLKEILSRYTETPTLVKPSLPVVTEADFEAPPVIPEASATVVPKVVTSPQKKKASKIPQQSPFSLADLEEPKPKQGDEILAWIDREGVASKSADYYKKGAKKVAPRSKRARELVVDLHGLTVAQAQVHIEKSMGRVKVEGYQQILFIHGRGNHSAGGEGKIKSLVLELLNGPLSERVASYHFAPPHEGGGGATRVILR